MKRKRFWLTALLLALLMTLRPPAPSAQAATYVVLYTFDSGVGSLRQAIIEANNHPGPDTITFQIQRLPYPPYQYNNCQGGLGFWLCTIQLATPLPPLTDDGTTIDGYTQFGAMLATEMTPAILTITIDGSAAGDAAYGFTIESSGNAIKGMVIQSFSRNGILIQGSNATDNTIAGNYIGTNTSGTAKLGNQWAGIEINFEAQNNLIGGDTPSARNVISGNDSSGVFISGTNNTVSGNYIGVDASGATALGNSDSGIVIGFEAQNNLIGGDTPGERNIISGNDSSGVSIDGANNTVSGNYIGVDAGGATKLGNQRHGVYLNEDAQNNLIGGDTPGERNIISSNDYSGVSISGANNTVSGNYIGVDAGGATNLGNQWHGVRLSDEAQNNLIGGDTPGERNVISGNNYYGVYILGSGANGNTISGNYIGVDAGGATKLGNRYGVYIDNGAQNNLIGGNTPGERNVISGNDYYGVRISGSGTNGNTISGNTIGVDANGATALGNTRHGVYITNEAQNNTIGPDNVIGYNGQNGVVVEGAGATGHTITQNSIFANTLGIELLEGANSDITAPVIVEATLGSVHISGTACPNCTVELFQNGDADGEGETYVGSATADAGGAFTVIINQLTQPYLTATATDARGTSEFSTVLADAPLSHPIYLPLVILGN